MFGVIAFVAVAPERRAHVLGGDPKDVGALNFSCAEVAELHRAPFAMVLDAEVAAELGCVNLGHDPSV